MRSLFLRAVAVAIATMPAAALAAPATSAPASNAAAQTSSAPEPFGTPLDESVMSKTTARADTSMIAQSRQTSTVSNNTITGNSTTGDINIAASAFQNASGLVMVNANSGNNVAMNGAMNVNIIMAGPSPQN